MARNCRHLFPMASRLFLSLALPSTLMWFGVGNGIIIITRKKMEAFLPLRGGARRGNTVVLVGAFKENETMVEGRGRTQRRRKSGGNAPIPGSVSMMSLSWRICWPSCSIASPAGASAQEQRTGTGTGTGTNENCRAAGRPPNLNLNPGKPPRKGKKRRWQVGAGTQPLYLPPFLVLSCPADSAFWLCFFQLAGAAFWPSPLVCHRGFIDGDGEEKEKEKEEMEMEG